MRGRHVAADVLAVLACLATLAVVPILWLDAQLHGTAYSDTVRPLAKDPRVQRAIADSVSETLAASGQGLPPVVVDMIRREIPAVMRTPDVTDRWVSASLAIRDTLLTGDGGEVTVDVGQLTEPLADRLGLAGFPFPAELASGATRIVLVDVPALAQVRTVARMTPTLAYVVPPLAAVLLALALLAARDRWRTLAVIGFVVAAGTVVEMLAIGAIQDRALVGVEDETSREILGAIAQEFSHSLRSALAIPLIVACGVAVAGLVLVRVTSSGADDRGRTQERIRSG
jgi:hypothetical protein